MLRRNQPLIALLFCGLLLAPTFAEAQRGGFGRSSRGGGGFPGGSSLSVLQEESVERELNLTEEQKTRIADLVESSRPDFSQMMPLMMQMRQAETDEQRDELRKQMAEMNRAPVEKAEAELKTLLSETQFTRYQQASRQRSGLRALMDDKESAALGLTDDQKEKLSQKFRDMFSRFRELRDLPENEQDAARKKMEDDVLSVLTESQRQSWNERLGEPIEGLSPGGRRDDRRPSGPPPSGPPAVASAPATTPPGGPAPMTPSQPPAGGGDLLDDMLGALESRPAGPSSPAVNPNVTSVADFGRSAADGPAESFSFNFRNAPWDVVLSLFAETAGLTLDPSVTPPGAFNYFDSNTYTPEEALDVMNGYLLPRGYLLLKRDKFLVVREISEGIPPSLVPTVAPEELTLRGKNEMVRVIFDTGQTPASELVTDVTALLGSQGKAVGLGASNRLIVEGVVRNLIQVQGLLEDTTRPVGPDGLAFRAYRLDFVNARDVEPMIKALLGVESGLGTSGSSSSRSSSRSSSSDDERRRAFFEMMRSRGGPPGFGGDSRSDGRSDRDRGSSSGSSSSSTTTTATARVAVDDRTNTLMVTAKPSDLDIVAQAVKELDVDDTVARSPSRGSAETPVLRVYKIDDGDLGKISETLTAMVPGIAINEDNRADQIHVVATPEKHREVAQMVSMITGDTLGHSVAVIPLSRMDAYSAGQIVINMFSTDNGESIPSVQADPSGQRLIVRGSEQDVQQVRSLLLQLGENGEPIELTPAQRGPVRELPLGGADPAETLRLLQRLWNAGHDRTLEVVPSPGAGNFDRPRRPAPQEDDSRASMRTRTDRFHLVFQDAPESSSDNVPSNGDDEIREIAPGVSATIIGDRLVISSSDLEALDSLESLAARLLNQTQSRTRWTVIYLQVAEASDVATMLGTFFPQASIGSSVASTSTTPSPTAQQLQIIPETRTNALFIAGSTSEVADVKEVLQILDSSEVPTAYRDRVPRSIPVEYASATEVAQVLEEVFADMLPRQTRSSGRGGFGREEETTTLQPGQLTIGVDAATSRIVVSCNEAVFAQVESIVQELDNAAREAKRSVRVVNLQNTDPAAVKGVLGTLLPQVSFTTSSSGTRTSSSSTRSGDSGRSSSDRGGESNPFDFFRRMREARERGESGGFGGGPPFGGFGGFGGDRGRDSGRGGSDRGRR